MNNEQSIAGICPVDRARYRAHDPAVERWGHHGAVGGTNGDHGAELGASRLRVLQNGKVVLEGSGKQLLRHPEVVKVYLGG